MTLFFVIRELRVIRGSSYLIRLQRLLSQQGMPNALGTAHATPLQLFVVGSVVLSGTRMRSQSARYKRDRDALIERTLQGIPGRAYRAHATAPCGARC